MRAALRALLSALVFFGFSVFPGGAAAKPSVGHQPTAQTATQIKEATVIKVDSTNVLVEYRDKTASPIPLDREKIKNGELGVELGDTVQLSTTGTPGTVTSAKITARTTSWGLRTGVLVAAYLLIAALMAIVTKGRPREFFIGTDRRYSNSKTQLALWFATVMAAYLSTLFLRVYVGGGEFLGAVSIPTNLLVLSGLSALTYGGAKVITTQKVDQAAAAGAAAPKAAAANPNLLTDLFQNDLGEADLGDFQMILITLVAIGIFACAVINFLAYIEFKAVSLPEIDTTLLSMFGVGQGAYLVKKLASPPGQG